ncbi:MAG: serine hydrolase [bacterium]
MKKTIRGRKRAALIALSVFMLLAAGVAVLAGVLASDMARVGTGYSAKIMCSSVFVAGRAPGEVEKVDLLATRDYPISVSVDRQKEEARASVFGLFQSRAVYRDGLGCTVVVDVSDEELAEQAGAAPPPASAPPKHLAWPGGSKVDLEELPPGLDGGKLAEALDFAFADPAQDRPVRTRAVVVVHKGKIVAERYAEGFSKDTPLLGWSMTKSVTNALIGILVKKGKLEINAPAPVPEWSGPEDPRSEITLDHLLRMKSGLEFIEEYEENITSDCNLMLFTKRDMAHFAAQKPLVAKPGEVWSYSSGTTNILSRIVRHTTGGGYEDYFAFPREELFDKLGMSSAVMEPDPSGTFVGSSNMYATARDWARFGLLYLQDGVWEGERILPEGWVSYSTTVTRPSEGRYGAQFWLNTGAAGNPKDRWMPELEPDVYSARGHDGQYVTVLPSHELVVVRLGFTPDHLGAWDHQEFLKKVTAAVER